jgi:hypothetical protein
MMERIVIKSEDFKPPHRNITFHTLCYYIHKKLDIYYINVYFLLTLSISKHKGETYDC